MFYDDQLLFVISSIIFYDKISVQILTECNILVVVYLFFTLPKCKETNLIDLVYLGCPNKSTHYPIKTQFNIFLKKLK